MTELNTWFDRAETDDGDHPADEEVASRPVGARSAAAGRRQHRSHHIVADMGTFGPILADGARIATSRALKGSTLARSGV